MTVKDQIIKKFAKYASKVFWEKRDSDEFLCVELNISNFDEVINISKDISSFVDQIDYSSGEYFLDIYSRGTDYDIEFKNIKNNLGKTMKIELNKAIEDKIIFIGELVSYDDKSLSIEWNNKGQFKNIKIITENIKKINLFSKIK
ncbi:hypothetical protein [Candidatus Mycoplasma mahonii]|uniref:hypothetical protein n=1 Tax=Candidatus Mycoplasma mahonii TaxID=3004105 RepID=UPI0026EB6896|nr:hypothetical protein [Candidatus Mycoplasma mahonii]WKX02534.1 hypothetical protein O3I44_00430 [Candidatus Mycoplasma mahonii]